MIHPGCGLIYFHNCFCLKQEKNNNNKYVIRDSITWKSCSLNLIFLKTTLNTKNAKVCSEKKKYKFISSILNKLRRYGNLKRGDITLYPGYLKAIFRAFTITSAITLVEDRCTSRLSNSLCRIHIQISNRYRACLGHIRSPWCILCWTKTRESNNNGQWFREFSWTKNILKYV